ncbi:hypothetical protein NT01EI_2408 [Edwardsiella ictaluri 93-146]|uniref:Mutator family transposase n=1 Tax=Edwardsiella ictaluri (strain 93-146) TaxID=634503 RepID=C5BA98_EDWI9|nr:hypothetical protein NT01EI_2408 [Edwardsiella ictaluri 93-146]
MSSLCRGIDERVQAFLQRPREGEWPYLWLNATYVKVRKNGRVVSVVVIIACAVSPDGRREIIGMGIGESEAKTFWLAFHSIIPFLRFCPCIASRLVSHGSLTVMGGHAGISYRSSVRP